jgi:Fe-S-cluster containining protein
VTGHVGVARCRVYSAAPSACRVIAASVRRSPCAVCSAAH